MKDKLLHTLEERTGLKMQRNHDFAYLSELLLAECHEYISTTTLKRMWGYIHDQESKPSKNTLNVIAKFLGFDDFADFCNRGGISVKGGHTIASQSEMFFSKACLSNELLVGDEVIVRWLPDRSCTFRCLGNNMFEVTRSRNAQLSVGDTFCCDLFAEGEMLKVYKLTHDGKSDMAYHAGKAGGIKFNVRRKNK